MAFEMIVQKIAEINPILGDAIIKNPWMLPLFLIQLLLKLIIYPIALYQAGKRNQKTWFVVLFLGFLFLNDLGLLPALYLIISRNLEKSNKNNSKKKKK